MAATDPGMKRWSVIVVVFVSISIVGLTVLILTTAKGDLASAEQTWRQAGIENYTLEIAVDGCMVCGGPDDPLRYSVVVANGETTSETHPPGIQHGYANVEELFREIESYGPDATVTYNHVGVPIEMELDRPEAMDDQAHYIVTFTET